MRTVRLVLICAVACVGALSSVAQAMAAPADLDRTFGGDGIVDVEGQAGAVFSHEAWARMAIGPADDIFVLYSSFGPCSPPFNECAIDLSVARYGRDGKRDPSFGSRAGSQMVVHQDPLAGAFALAVGPDGKPVVAANSQGAIVVARFDREGRLDGTFGAGGVALTPLGGTSGRPPAVAVQPDGKVVVAVEAGSVTLPELRLTRFLPNGAPDPGFGNSGNVSVATATGSRPAALLLGADDSISVAAPQCCAGQAQSGNAFTLARFLPSGSLDPGLAGTGQFVFPTAGTRGSVEAAALASDGGAFIVFEEELGSRSTVGNLVKLLPDGSLDYGFGSEGRVQIANRVGVTDPSGLVIDGKGRLVGLGWDGNISLFRLRANGSADRTFNGGQHISVKIGGNQEAPIAIGLQSGGRIVALAETSCCGPKTFALIGLRGGTSHVRCLRQRATIVGTRGKDELTGTRGRDVIAALGGRDEVRGLAGNDVICGGPGRDRIFGGPGQDRVRR
jgi:uncharacterized delta-60 repeat protein